MLYCGPNLRPQSCNELDQTDVKARTKEMQHGEHSDNGKRRLCHKFRKLNRAHNAGDSNQQRYQPV